MDSHGARRRALLAQMRLDIKRANAAGAARRRALRQAAQWRERLLGFEGAEVEALDAALRRAVDDGEVPPDMAQRVDRVVARATAAEQRAYALGVIRDELAHLGYVVEAGFDTLAPDAPRILLRNPELEEDYLVSLSAEPGASLLRNEVVREAGGAVEGSAGPERRETDERMQRTWCRHLATALGGRLAPRRTRAGSGEIRSLASCPCPPSRPGAATPGPSAGAAAEAGRIPVPPAEPRG